MPTVIASAGSSTLTGGNGRGSAGSAIVSPIITSGRPASAMISPGPASVGVDAGHTFSHVQLGDLHRCTEPSRRHHATVWPRSIAPSCTRHSASRPT